MPITNSKTMLISFSVLSALALSACSDNTNSTGAENAALASAISGSHRTESFAARDTYRNPQATLAFFGVEPNMTVVEVWPGGGWYTEILAPYLQNNGTLYAAHFNAEHPRDFYRNSRANFEQKIQDPLYSAVQVTTFDLDLKTPIAPAGSADMVLSFRSMHNWYMQAGDEGLEIAFRTFYDALKPGGVLGIVDHRLPEIRRDADMQSSGYMKESWAIAFAEAAGFEFVGASQVNANPKDTADHEGGVWALPPTLRHGDTDRDRYMEIGESDRFTLKFRKPDA
ncbi:class I SAM-dependent methyltransferase [Aliidiomarina celeris]|uniref:class I SAM-dependent methyltransferase n=1 Tax=Aliidiomarina celeris TaxID=2249428 RepID=UPI000DE8EB1D|nr:class I SAM-dependent methyltransferase [Aliidiomarina celeris]